jgi:hypothetical protein
MTARLLNGPLMHFAAAGDQADQDADQRDEQHEQEHSAVARQITHRKITKIVQNTARSGQE